GISAPVAFRDVNHVGPRFVSNTVFDQTDPTDSTMDLDLRDQRGLSDFIYVFGQFLDHDLDLTKHNSGQSFSIPPGSPTDPMGTEPFTRSTFDPNTGTSTSNPRQQVQENPSFIDASQVYGSDPVLADQLRTHSGGHLKSQVESNGSGGTGTFLPFK